MKKLPFESFLKAVSLGGRIESAKLVSNGTVLSSDFRDATNNLFGFLKEDIAIPEGEYCIADIRKLLSILGILSDDITVQIHHKQNTTIPLQIIMADETATVNFALANERNILQFPKISGIELNLNASWTLTDDIIEPVMKAIRILSDDAIMTITPEKKILIGRTSGNSTTATIMLPESVGTISKSVSFSTENFNAILSANSLLLDKSSMSIYNDDLMILSFDNEKRKYWIPKKNIV